jgi:hypothetical protein
MSVKFTRRVISYTHVELLLRHEHLFDFCTVLTSLPCFGVCCVVLVVPVNQELNQGLSQGLDQAVCYNGSCEVKMI